MASWQAAFVAESAALSSEDHVQALLDLVKAFETVPHAILVRAAASRGYPILVLRLSIAAYRLSRSIGVDGVYSRLVVASRGITAGSGFATSELRALLSDTMEELHRRWARTITVKLFVDDLTLSTGGLPQGVVATMVSVVDFVIDEFETELLMEVSAKKSKVLACRPAIALAVGTRVKSCKLDPVRYAKLLGTDSAGGRRRGTQVSQARLVDFTASSSRFQVLRRLGVNTKQMVRAAGPPAMLYGCEVMGLSDTALHAARVKVAAAAAPQAGGKNPELVLYVLDGAHGTLDPAFEAHTNPLKYWALAWWQRWFSAEQMQRAYEEGAAKVSASKGSWWSVVAGPTTALLASLKRLGWVMRSAEAIVDDTGMVWRLDQDSPAAIVRAGRHAVRRWRLKRIGEALPGLLPDAGDIPQEAHFTSTVLVDFSCILSPLVTAMGCWGSHIRALVL